MNIRHLSIIIFFIFIIIPAQGQEQHYSYNPEDILIEQNKLFQRIAEEGNDENDSLWYFGRQYRFQTKETLGSLYFYDQPKMKADLIFNGTKLYDLEVFYDLVQDEIVYQSPETFAYIELNRLWVNGFTLYFQGQARTFYPNAHYFQDGELNTGYYEEIFKGETIFLIKHKKYREFKANENNLFQYIYEKDFLLIKNDNVLDVSGKRKFLRAFHSFKKEIRSFIRENNLKYEEMTRNEIVLLMSYCETFI